jgi:hypothetical protein
VAAGSKSTIPPKRVQVNAQKGLDAASDGKGGKAVGNAAKERGKALASGKPVPASTLKAIHKWHKSDAADNTDGSVDQPGTAAHTASMLHGGPAGAQWVMSVIPDLDDDGDDD